MKEKEKMPIVTAEMQKAVDNLSAIAAMEVDAKTPIGVVKEHKIVIGEEAYDYQTIDWVIPENADDLLDNINYTYRTILEYLKELYEKHSIDLEDRYSLEGLQAIMVLVGEAADKLNRYLALFHKMKEEIDVKTSKEYRDLQAFYLQTIAKKGKVEGKEAWQEEWAKNPQAPVLDIEKSGLKDFEAVKLDQDYELFYLKNEDEEPFFSRELIRNIKLYCNFEELGDKDLSGDPLLKIPYFQDKEFHFCAKEIYRTIYDEASKFYQHREQSLMPGLVEELHKAIMALMLASNPKNTLENTSTKSSSQYFDDFLHFLRRALTCDDFGKILSYAPEDRDQILMNLTCNLAGTLFTHVSGIKEEFIGYIYYLIKEGEERVARKEQIRAPAIWETLLAKDDKIRSLLKFYPNGPLLKVVDALNAEEKTFDTIMQGNIPGKLYDFNFGKEVTVLHLPVPIQQTIISNAHIDEEFLAFLRTLSDKRGGHLLINLQDKTSWKEYARAAAIEELAKKAEFSKELSIVTLTKNTDFYFQTGPYEELNHAQDFLDQFYEQFKSAEECGFFLPKNLQTKDFYTFIQNAIKTVHKVFFGEKNVLSQKNRLDFIEIFYNLLILKIIEIIKPASMSFSCKDGVDTGAAMAASFYAVLHLLQGEAIDKNNKDMLVYLFYAPALLIRHRAIDAERFNRVISALAHFDFELHVDLKKNLKELSKLFKHL